MFGEKFNLIKSKEIKLTYKNHLTTGLDLVTAYEKTRAGFVALAIERNRRATPFIDQARVLKNIATQASIPSALINIVEIQPALLAASGVSDKAAGYLQPEDKIQAIQGLIKEFLEAAFIGTAIEKRMAEEIWSDLESGKLTNAANMTNDTQLDSMCHWLINL
jgi:Restriction endonuclease BsobI